VRIDVVDVESDRYKIARTYMLRLKPEDFDDPRELARLAQVIVVTHLPQVAAFADNHLVVAKSSDGSITSTSVIRLDHEARVRELSRMLAGLEDSEFGQAHAAELLAMAADQAARP